jgi:hypothetical protein
VATPLSITRRKKNILQKTGVKVAWVFLPQISIILSAEMLDLLFYPLKIQNHEKDKDFQNKRFFLY